MIRIIAYERKYHGDYKRLNLDWLEQYHLTESHDLEILDNPEEKIITPGGCLFLALDNDKVIGTAGLMKENADKLELVKMTVDPAYRGHGIGKQLLEHCLVKARELNANKIFLYSNSQLKTALKLYEQYGFAYVTVTDSPLLTADVKMELNLI
jgi:putative acetyltransferase